MDLQTNIGATFTTENLITSEEAVIAAAAAEAVALAKAAVQVAKDAAVMVSHDNFTKSDTKEMDVPSDANTLMFETTQSYQLAERISVIRESKADEFGLSEDHSSEYAFMEAHNIEPTNEELELLQEQISANITVKSRRQKERKAKRARATERVAANVVSVKSGSSGKKKRSSMQDVDYADPLRYLRGTTSSSRLLTANEEQVLSEGIQVRKPFWLSSITF